MAWKIEFDRKAKKELFALDNSIKKRIDKFILKLSKENNPRILGEPLKGNFQSFWKFRVGHYRLICNIKDKAIIILVLRVQHRKAVYKKHFSK